VFVYINRSTDLVLPCPASGSMHLHVTCTINDRLILAVVQASRDAKNLLAGWSRCPLPSKEDFRLLLLVSCATRHRTALMM
jgi:hypothetical protein